MPAPVAARPRDARGYPVPAITPWVDGAPQFAATGTARTYICAVERRCSICGTTMAPGPVWRVIAGGEVEAIEEARAGGYAYENRAATTEAPGHYACMLYAAVVCPYLARPQARRGAAETTLSVQRGHRRGELGAVVGFERYEFRLQEAVLFRFGGLVSFFPAYRRLPSIWRAWLPRSAGIPTCRTYPGIPRRQDETGGRGEIRPAHTERRSSHRGDHVGLDRIG